MTPSKEYIGFDIPNAPKDDWTTYREEQFSIWAEIPDEEMASRQMEPIPHYYINIASKDMKGEITVTKRMRVYSHKTVIFEIADGFGFRCFHQATPSTPVKLEGDSGQLAHFLVHPHGMLDPDGKLKGKLGPYLADVELSSHVFLESDNMPYHIMRSADREKEGRQDAMVWINIDVFNEDYSNASLHVAPGGVFNFVTGPERRFPDQILITGTFGAVPVLIAHAARDFALSESNRLDIYLPKPLLALDETLEDTEDPKVFGEKVTEQIEHWQKINQIEPGEIDFSLMSQCSEGLSGNKLLQKIKEITNLPLKAVQTGKNKLVVLHIIE